MEQPLCIDSNSGPILARPVDYATFNAHADRLYIDRSTGCDGKPREYCEYGPPYVKGYISCSVDVLNFELLDLLGSGSGSMETCRVVKLYEPSPTPICYVGPGASHGHASLTKTRCNAPKVEAE